MAFDHSPNAKLLALENKLKQDLHPVEPNQRFIQKLRTRLEDSPILMRQQRVAATLLTVAGGLLIGLAVFLIGRGFLRQTGQT